jgi:hypothetical protein
MIEIDSNEIYHNRNLLMISCCIQIVVIYCENNLVERGIAQLHVRAHHITRDDLAATSRTYLGIKQKLHETRINYRRTKGTYLGREMQEKNCAS